MSTKIADLQNRWLKNEQTHFSLKTILQLAERGCFFGRNLFQKEFSPFGLLEDGRIDFRGIDFSGLKKITKAEFRNADLSFCNFDNRWVEKSSFEDVIFEKTAFTSFSDHGNEFTRVIFKNCNFNGSHIGYDGSIYKDVIFEKSTFRKAGFIRAEFTGSQFVNCGLNGVDMDASSFENCTFKGKVENVWFRGGFALPADYIQYGNAKKNRMRNVSFEDAELKSLTFSNDCDLSTIKMPKTGNYLLFDNWLHRLERLAKSVTRTATGQNKGVELFIKVRLNHARTQNWYLLNLDEEKQLFGIDDSVFDNLKMPI